MNASDIKKLLAEKHSEDFFLTECKNGPTFTAQHLRLDAVAIKKSWTRPCVTGYEVKISRSDFLHDDKWPQYLKYCNRFSFVCPKGLIKKEELPDENVGLIYVNPNQFLRTVKAVPMRHVDIPTEFYQYIIMCRLDSDRTPFYSTKAEYIKAYISDKKSAQELSYNFKTALIERAAKAEEKVREFEAWKTGKEAESYQKITDMLRKHRIYLFGDDWEVELDNLLTRAEQIKKIDSTIENLRGIAERIDHLKEKAG